jgi:hypothetical protein
MTVELVICNPPVRLVQAGIIIVKLMYSMLHDGDWVEGQRATKALTLVQCTSRQPMGTIAAATWPTPRSVASRLNCAAAFLVSWTSNRMPRSLRYLRTAGARGIT